MSAGGEHTLRTTSDGTVHSAGACGLGWNRLAELNPSLFGWRKVELPETVSAKEGEQIASGYYHNLAIGQSGRLYSWGCGTFPDGAKNDGCIPGLGQGLAALDRGSQPTPVLGLEKGERVSSVAAGAYHSVALTPTGRVLTFGAAQLGQLGRSVTGSVQDASGLPVDPLPRPVEGLPASEVPVRIGAGFYNTFVACESGQLYCSGENQNRQCGIEVTSEAMNIPRMQRVADLKGERVRHAQGGYCHTLALLLDGRVLTMGCGDDGQRGDGIKPDVTEARLGVQREPAEMIASGANHSVALTRSSKVYAWGSDEFGQCGGGGEGGEVGGLVLTPQEVQLPPHAGRIVSVSAGYAHTVLRDDRGAVYVMGQNESGQLGLGGGSFKNPADVRSLILSPFTKDFKTK